MMMGLETLRTQDKTSNLVCCKVAKVQDCGDHLQ